MAFLDEFMQAYGGQASRDLSAGLGLKKAAAAQIIPAVVPMILGGLKRQMETQGGAARIDHILNKYGSDSVLDDIAGAIGNRAGQAADAQLGGIAALLDRDGDGSILDDVAGMLFQGSASPSSGGGLGKLLGGLFGGRR